MENDNLHTYLSDSVLHKVAFPPAKNKDEEEFNQFLDKFISKIEFLANRFGKISENCGTLDYMYSKDDFVMEGIHILYLCWKRYAHKIPEENCEVVCNYSIERGIIHLARGKRKNENIYVDITTDYMNEEEYEQKGKQRHATGSKLMKMNLYTTPFDKFIDDYEVELFIKEVEKRTHSKIEKAILEEMIHPSPRTLFNAMMDEKRKKMMEKQAINKYTLKEVNIQHQHIYRSLKITKQQFDYAFKNIRKRAKEVYELMELGKVGETI